MSNTSKNTEFTRGVEIILETIMFENWLRFYFISEKTNEPDKIFLAIPEKGMERIQELYPHLLPLAQDLNGKELTFETSRTAVCTYIVTEVDGKIISRNMSDLVFDSAMFQMELQLFNTWLQAHEDKLDAQFFDFGSWKKLHKTWRDSEEVQAWATKILEQGNISPNSTEDEGKTSTETVQ